MSQALSLIDNAIAAQKRMLKGYEKPCEVLAFATTRALDQLFLQDLFHSEEGGADTPQVTVGHATMSWGTNEALRRIVPDNLKSEPFKLFRSTEQMQSQTNDFIFHCGCLAKAERLSGWLKEGLIEAEVRNISLPNSPQTEFVILLKTADPSLNIELIGREGLRWTSRFVMSIDRDREEELKRFHREMRPLLEQAVDIFEDWGIQYASSREVEKSTNVSWNGQRYTCDACMVRILSVSMTSSVVGPSSSISEF